MFIFMIIFLVNFFVTIDAMENSQVGIYITNNTGKEVEVGNLTESEGKIIFSPLKTILPKIVSFVPGLKLDNFYIINGKLPFEVRKSDDFQAFIKNGKSGDFFESGEKELGNFTGFSNIGGTGFLIESESKKKIICKKETPKASSYSVENTRMRFILEPIKLLLENAQILQLKDIPTLEELCLSYVVSENLSIKKLPECLKEKWLDIKMAHICYLTSLLPPDKQDSISTYLEELLS